MTKRKYFPICLTDLKYIRNKACKVLGVISMNTMLQALVEAGNFQGVLLRAQIFHWGRLQLRTFTMFHPRIFHRCPGVSMCNTWAVHMQHDFANEIGGHLQERHDVDRF